MMDLTCSENWSIIIVTSGLGVGVSENAQEEKGFKGKLVLIGHSCPGSRAPDQVLTLLLFLVPFLSFPFLTPPIPLCPLLHLR